MKTSKLAVSIFIISIILLSTACSSQQAYRPAQGNGYGYTETEISENRYRVQFKSRGENRQKAMDYALLRSAELTLLQGYDWFVVVDRETVVEREQDQVRSTVRNEQVVTRDCGLLGCSTSVQQVPSYGVEVENGRPGETESILEIRMGKGIRPTSGDSYDAAKVRESLKSKS